MGNVLKVTFNNVPSVNDEIWLRFYGNYPTLPGLEFNRGNVFKTNRVNPGEVTIGANTTAQAENYAAAFVLDYGVSFTVYQLANVVYLQPINGSPVFDYGSDSAFIVFELVDEIPFEPNMIHEIIFTPRQYAVPSGLERNYLITENEFFVVTEDDKKIRL